MSDPEEGSPVDPSQIDRIDNPDTLRMALRWALERLGALQKSNEELARNAEWQIQMRAKSEETLKKQWESETAYLQKNLANRQAQLETAHESRRLELDREHRRKIAEVERGWGAPEDAELLEATLASLERERAEKTRALDERERLLRESEGEFERFCRVQRESQGRELELVREEERRRLAAQAPDPGEIAAWKARASESLAAAESLESRKRELEASLGAGAEEIKSWRRRALEAEAREAEWLLRLQAPPLPSLDTARIPAEEPGRWEDEKTTLLDRLKRWKDAALQKAAAARELKRELAAVRQDSKVPKAAALPAPASPAPADESRRPPAPVRIKPRRRKAAAGGGAAPARPPEPAAVAPSIPVPAPICPELPAPLVRIHDGRSLLYTAVERERRLARAAYFGALDAMESYLRGPGAADAVDRLGEPLLNLLELVKSRNQALLVLIARAPVEPYPAAHAVNVAVLSMSVASGLRAPPGLPHAVGLAALLNDLSLMRVMGAGPGVPRPEDEPRLHPVGDSPAFLAAVERAARLSLAENGRGRLGPLLEDGLRQVGALVGLCEIYETLSHSRPGRAPLTPHEALKSIIETYVGSFDRGLLKAFLGRVTIFPPGSTVELSTGEHAQVLEVHAEDTMDPTLEICLKTDGTAPLEPMVLRLSENPYVRILRALPDPDS